MDKTVIKLVVMLGVALVATLIFIGLEFKTKQVRLVNTGAKAILAVVIAGLLVSVV